MNAIDLVFYHTQWIIDRHLEYRWTNENIVLEHIEYNVVLIVSYLKRIGDFNINITFLILF